MNNIKYKYIFQFLFSFFFIFGIVFIILGFNDYKIVKYTYSEKNDVNYKVYLKKNAFFDTDYLEENRTYISSLIDYIDVDYHYSVDYSDLTSGDYSYKLVAIVRSLKHDSDDYYWEKQYDLTDYKTGSINETKRFSLDENIKIDYDKYNQILTSFKKEFAFASEGNLEVAMIITSNVTSEYSNDPIVISSNINLSVPLLEQTVEARIGKNINSTSNAINIKQKDKSITFLIYKISGIGMTLISSIYFLLLITNKLSHRHKDAYEKTLKKILKNYDSIIANVTNKPALGDLKKVEVSDFNELLDIYNEVRMPINYYQDDINNTSTFVIYNDTLVWMYKIKKSDFAEGK